MVFASTRSRRSSPSPATRSSCSPPTSSPSSACALSSCSPTWFSASPISSVSRRGVGVRGREDVAGGPVKVPPTVSLLVIAALCSAVPSGCRWKASHGGGERADGPRSVTLATRAWRNLAARVTLAPVTNRRRAPRPATERRTPMPTATLVKIEETRSGYAAIRPPSRDLSVLLVPDVGGRILDRHRGEELFFVHDEHTAELRSTSRQHAISLPRNGASASDRGRRQDVDQPQRQWNQATHRSTWTMGCYGWRRGGQGHRDGKPHVPRDPAQGDPARRALRERRRLAGREGS